MKITFSFLIVVAFASTMIESKNDTTTTRRITTKSPPTTTRTTTKSPTKTTTKSPKNTITITSTTIKCKKNEVYKTCGTDCDNAKTCDTPVTPATYCSNACKPGCYCADGYFRKSTTDSNCIKLADCPNAKCGKNEYFINCTTLCIEPTCASRMGYYCGAGCQAKCLCNDGFIRKKTGGNCIDPADC